VLVARRRRQGQDGGRQQVDGLDVNVEGVDIVRNDGDGHVLRRVAVEGRKGCLLGSRWNRQVDGGCSGGGSGSGARSGSTGPGGGASGCSGGGTGSCPEERHRLEGRLG